MTDIRMPTLDGIELLLDEGSFEELDALVELLGFPSGTVEELTLSTPDRLVSFITSGAVTTLLVLAGLVALYLEITSPGFGIPGTLAIIAFAVVFIGGALLGIAVFQQGCDQAFPVIHVRGDGHAAVFDIDTDAADSLEFFQGMGDGVGAAAAPDVFNLDDMLHAVPPGW